MAVDQVTRHACFSLRRASGALVAVALLLLAPGWACAWESEVGRADVLGAVGVTPDGGAVAVSDYGAARLSAKGVLLRRGRLSVQPTGWVGHADAATDANGDAFFIGQVIRALSNGQTQLDFGILKVSGTDGRQIWRVSFDDPPDPLSHAGWGRARAAAVTAAGDVVVGGAMGQPAHAVIAKLAGATGDVLWSSELSGTTQSHDMIFDLALTPSGDVVAVGEMDAIAMAMKLDGATGMQLWQAAIPGAVGTSWSSHVTLDGAADLFVAGYLSTASDTQAVTKLSGVDGSMLWQVEPPDLPLRIVEGMAASAGDVVVGGQPEPMGTVLAAKLSGATGNVLWTYQPSVPSSAYLVDVISLPSGDAVVAGTEPQDPTHGVRVSVSRLRSSDGAPQWNREYGSRVLSGGGILRHNPLRLDGAGNILLSMALDQYGNRGAAGDPDTGVVLRLGADGSDGLAAERLSLRQTPGGLRMKFAANKGIGVTLFGDSDPVAGGAVLEVRNPTSGETASATLNNWSTFGPTDNPRGLAHRDGTCTVKLRAQGTLSVSCRGLLGLTLDEASQGSLAVRLTLGGGSAARVYCAVFGGTITADAPGLFRAAASPAPDICPFP